MSHLVEQECLVKDLDALTTACARLGLELRRGQTQHAWWGRFVGDSPGLVGRDPATYGTCDHAIGEPGVVASNGRAGNWEIGVVKRLDGHGYTLVVDTFGSAGRRLQLLAGANLKTLIEEYGVEVATKRLRRDGYRVSRGVEAKTGKIKLTCSQ